MLITREISKSGDPSDKNQIFKGLKFNILCCRYWWFEVWKGQRMSFPYWRLYWNKNEGAYVYYQKKTYLLPGNIYLIPPHTPFSTGIQNQKLAEESEYFFKCGRIDSKEVEKWHFERGNILHFFTHFTLGFPYDDVKPGVYILDISDERKNDLKDILNTLIFDSTNFSLKESLSIYHLILSSINSLPQSIWLSKKVDHRIMTLLEYMERNMAKKMTSKTLASQLCVSPSSFLRLFKTNVGKSPSKYLTQIRIDKACNLLLHTDTSMDTIAEQCGFTDRYHLTKVFSNIKKISPAAFRKGGGYY
ncbi:AraC family transcriptional regulator [Fulvivirgaceae bacterium BMA12]|uniref:AraC family transcriptional regulator n=1 Tax=Agaribacillus aureus TaxID=3051825 RepID=A0ABT8LI63_9BACT|nr:AraC family transcriptional regulator [Fulvivirgaceae bacterium BMA12]